ncbi:hypothetical protein PRUB_b6000 [Pseudoalteromonas rubra]|uniref:Uncharacterized protein n=1 Tax=Pseudoalteromonas rubra TaxID=43658 RepID=A0A8T0BYC8_9GAMM|nr:hypothetical protein PRUB_b6000 [Pseudoalteromonas rubra]
MNFIVSKKSMKLYFGCLLFQHEPNCLWLYVSGLCGH